MNAEIVSKCGFRHDGSTKFTPTHVGNWDDPKKMGIQLPQDEKFYHGQVFQQYLTNHADEIKNSKTNAIEVINFWPSSEKKEEFNHVNSLWNEFVVSFPTKSIRAILYDDTYENALEKPTKLAKALGLPLSVLMPFAKSVNIKENMKLKERSNGRKRMK